ncbi:UNKNOWN [Stylonychia lemnae]|uniref:Transmembrane protein n=1 Tax=Stylonychia lemnae TaxID=5949 RepID=A0A078AJY6_STYLE|nr:UNKNOWN [Stylonychia lemnae]|eukprot:CDW81772.1 UNKNOWN [Stylonychia lemnae]
MHNPNDPNQQLPNYYAQPGVQGYQQYQPYQQPMNTNLNLNMQHYPQQQPLMSHHIDVHHQPVYHHRKSSSSSHGHHHHGHHGHYGHYGHHRIYTPEELRHQRKMALIVFSVFFLIAGGMFLAFFLSMPKMN